MGGTPKHVLTEESGTGESGERLRPRSVQCGVATTPTADQLRRRPLLDVDPGDLARETVERIRTLGVDGFVR